MKNILSLFAMFALLSLAMQAQDTKKDTELIKKTIITAYQDGLQNEGDLDKIDKGFHPSFNMIAVNEKGEVWKYPIADWKKATEKKVADGKLPRPDGKKVKIEIPMVDISGNAAVAKLKFFVGDKLTYVDYMSLYKLDGKWKIVAKIYTSIK